jgi:hypothetical protein
MRNRQRTNHGGSMVEFSILVPVWLPLLIGTMWLGSGMIRGQQTTQMARDLGSMYSRGTDFSAGGTSNTMLQQITSQLGGMPAGGDGVAIFSTLTYVGKGLCPAMNCTNYQKFVFTQQYTEGNASLLTSNFGAPTSTKDAAGNLLAADYISNAGDESTYLTNSGLIPKPLENGQDGYQAGSPIYVVEVYFSGTSLAGFTSGGNYAYAIF